MRCTPAVQNAGDLYELASVLMPSTKVTLTEDKDISRWTDAWHVVQPTAGIKSAVHGIKAEPDGKMNQMESVACT